jgi:Na+/H+ antiporter NhaD/arsenite permease-like protein
MLAELSLAALVIAMLVSCTTRLNVGVLSLALAWIVGVWIGEMPLSDVIGAFPLQLFLMLVGVTLLFSQAQLNGTLDRLANKAVQLCKGNTGLVPIMFFALALGIASLGPGNVATAAMLAPMAMAVAARANISRFLMAIMVGNGAQAGSLSPFAPTGIIVNGIMGTIDLGGNEWFTYWTNMTAHGGLAFAGYFAFGGLKLFRSRFVDTSNQDSSTDRFESKHLFSLAIILTVVISVLFLEANIGMAAFTGAVILAASRVADHEQAIRNIPWTPIIMVTGVTVLIGLMQRTGGLELFTAALARFATQDSVTGLLAFLTGVISVYSSTSGVVLPAFLPTIPGLLERLGGGDPLALAASMNIGAHLVDMSPLSTTGAICLAAVTTPSEVRPTYNRLLAWGLSMSVVGGVLCYVVF